MPSRRLVALLNQIGHRLAVFAIGKAQVLDIGANDRCGFLIAHIDELLLVVGKEHFVVEPFFERTLPHDKRFDAASGRRTGRIRMDREKQIAFGLVGDVGTGLQILCQRRRELFVGFARIDHFYFRQLALDHRPQLERDLQVQVFLIDAAIVGAGEIRPPVSGIDHDNTDTARNIFRRRTVRTECEGYAKRQKKNETSHGKSGFDCGVSLNF